MKLEIEAKIKVDSLEKIAQRLKDAGAEFKCDVTERDSYFADAGGSIVKKGCGLRLRVLKTGDGEKYILTYKGPKQGGRYKKRQEIEVGVDGPEAMEEMLSTMGCEKRLTFEKKRSLWELDGCMVSLDELPLLGSFIEVEGPDEETISKVLVQLGIDGAEHICKGYARMMADKLEEIGSEERRMFFDDTI